MSVQAILGCFKQVLDWNITPYGGNTAASALGSDDPSASSNPALAATAGLTQQSPKSFFDRITKDIEIVRVALLLTGCIQVNILCAFLLFW